MFHAPVSGLEDRNEPTPDVDLVVVKDAVADLVRLKMIPKPVRKWFASTMRSQPLPFRRKDDMLAAEFVPFPVSYGELKELVKTNSVAQAAVSGAGKVRTHAGMEWVV